MQYLHSKLIDPSTYETEGLCDGIPLRAHLSRELEDIGTIRAQQDWNKYVGPINQYEGGLGPQYSFMTVSVPECLPDRLEIISYANEFAFLHDGRHTIPEHWVQNFTSLTLQQTIWLLRRHVFHKCAKVWDVL